MTTKQALRLAAKYLKDVGECPDCGGVAEEYCRPMRKDEHEDGCGLLDFIKELRQLAKKEMP
jgi:hypothetical protein